MVRHFDIMIDHCGWAQDKRRRPKWRPSARARTNVRSCLPWTPTEDRVLLRRVAGATSIGYADPMLQAASVAHGRSISAIATRINALKAGLRLAMAAKQAASETTNQERKQVDG